MGIGICTYFSLENEPSFAINIAIFALTLTICVGILRYEQKKMLDIYPMQYAVNFCFGAAITITLGFLVAQIRTISVNTYMIHENQPKPISFVATIKSCEKTDKGLKFIVSKAKRKYYDTDNELCKKFSNLHLNWAGETARESVGMYIPGSQWLFRAILSPIRPKAFFGAYDFRKQQFFKGISARGFILKAPKLIKESKQPTIHQFIEQLRYYINKTIENYLPKDVAAIVKALITGNTSGITKQIRANFSNSGTAHILAISGLHIGIIGFFVFGLIRLLLCCITRISMFYDVKKIAAVVSWFAVLFYLQISGCSVSSVRAFIMHSIIILAILCDRQPFTMRSIAIAATLIMLYSPEVIMFPSFQMSFGAVIAIIAYVESGFGMPSFLRWLSEVVVVTILASIPTSIISISVFNQLTLNSIFANIICIPLMTFFIMPILLLSLPLMPFDFVQWPLSLAGLGIEALMKIAERISQLPGSFLAMPTPTPFVFGTIVVSYLIFTMIQHRIRLLGAVGMIVSVILYIQQPLPDLFIAPNGKNVGIRTPECVCFSDLRYFRSMTRTWSKSVGLKPYANFRSKMCRKYVEWLGDDTYSANIHGTRLNITKNKITAELNGSSHTINRKSNTSTELFYFNPLRKSVIEQTHRPWD